MNFLIRIGLVLALAFNLGFCEELIVASWPVIEASLYINGKMVGETPFNTTINPGTYKLKVEKSGWIGEEREIIIKKGEEYVFVNISMRREKEEIPTFIPPETNKLEPKDVEIPKIEIEPQKITEIPKIEPPKIEAQKIEVLKVEPPKIEAQKTNEEINTLILKASSLIEKAEDEGGERYAKKRLKNAKNLLKKAKKENSFELAELSCKEAELALKETEEKISHYSSSYIMAIFKNIGK